MNKLFLIDAYALIYRMYFAFMNRPMRNAEGVNTSPMFGFTKFLRELMRREQPHYLGVAFDSKGATFRHEMFPAYKANRAETPEDIHAAVPYIKRILDAMRIPVCEKCGWEADDIIGTLSHKACDAGFEVFMVTPDKDFGQLVTPCAKIYKQRKDGEGIEIVDMDKIKEYYGVDDPRLIIDILALWGDASDNIPGIPGIGEKSAIKLVNEFGTVENILANIDMLKGKQKENILANSEQLLLSKKLATIDIDAPISFEPDRLEVEAPHPDELREIYQELGFTMFLREMESGIFAPYPPSGSAAKQAANAAAPTGAAHAPGAADASGVENDLHAPGGPRNSGVCAAADASDVPDVAAASHAFAPPRPVAKGMQGQGSLFDSPRQVQELDAVPQSDISADDGYSNINDIEHTYNTVRSAGELRDMVERLEKNGSFAFDTETTGFDVFNDRLVGMSFAIREFEAWYVPFDRSNQEEYLAILKPLFENENIEKIGQNIKFDMMVLLNAGVKTLGFKYDTMLLHYLLDPESRHGMNHLARTYLGYSPIEIESLIGRGAKQITMDMVPVGKVSEYAAEDADVTLRLKNVLWPQVVGQSLEKLYREIEEPMIAVLADMEMDGVRVDTKILTDSGRELSGKLAGLEDEIRKAAGEPSLNVNSARQLGEVLFGKMKIDPKPKTTKTKQYRTDEEYLQSLAGKNPVINLILEYRGIKKLLSTYIEALPQLVNPKTGRVHTSYNQAVTSTGRLSSSNPNLQNIPIRDEQGREIRKAFVPADDDHLLFSADYSQVELRLMAHLSGDENLLDAFRAGEDIHAATASLLFGVPLPEVTQEQRRRAKTANFGIIYGISAFGLSQRLNIPRTEAAEIITGYFRSYPGVKDYMERVIAQAREEGYVTTLFGRKRFLPDIRSANVNVRGLAERNAINAPIQGSAADIMKLAMIAVHAEFAKRGLRSRVILQVHDELVVDMYKPEQEQVADIVVKAMEGAAKLAIPLTVDYGIGTNWIEAH